MREMQNLTKAAYRFNELIKRAAGRFLEAQRCSA
jgi:hypothetical protein